MAIGYRRAPVLSEAADREEATPAAPGRDGPGVLPALVVTAAATALIAWLAFAAGARLAGWLMIMTGALASGVAVVLTPERDRLRGPARRWGRRVVPAVPGVLVVYLSFNGGGYRMAPLGFVTVMLALAIAVRVAIVRQPFAGVNRSFVVAAAALAAYAAWTLLSATWSDAPGRALTEFARVVLYLEALVFFGLRARSNRETGLMMRWIVAGIAVVCAAGLTTRLLPEVWPIDGGIAPERLSYPLTYWNALGVLATIGIVLTLHLASSRAQPAVVRVLGAALVPLLSVTLYFTFSRGAMFAAALGCVAYAVVGRPRGLVLALAAAGPATALAVSSAYGADALAAEDPTVGAAIDQGHDVALALAVAMMLASAIRILLLRLDRPLGRMSVPAPVAWPAAALLAVAIAVAALALGVPDRLADNYDRFVAGNEVEQTGDLRDRLTDPGNNHRLDQWDVALAAFRDDRATGTGAGTNELEWDRRRPYAFDAVDAHSLFAEVLGELGIVGLALLALALGTLLSRLVMRVWSSRSRTAYAALLAAALAWLVHAGVDWDWEMPAVTLWFFAVAGYAGARPAGAPRAIRPPGAGVRIAASLAVLALALVPALVAASDSRLGAARDAFGRGDCGVASRAARDSIEVLDELGQPHEILGYCALFDGRDGAPHMLTAIERDPGNAEHRYGLAMTQAARGADPRPALEEALRDDPRSPLILGAIAQTRDAGPRGWRRWAERAPLPERY